MLRPLHQDCFEQSEFCFYGFNCNLRRRLKSKGLLDRDDKNTSGLLNKIIFIELMNKYKAKLLQLRFILRL